MIPKLLGHQLVLAGIAFSEISQGKVYDLDKSDITGRDDVVELLNAHNQFISDTSYPLLQISDNTIIGDGVDEVYVTVYGQANELVLIEVLVGETRRDMQIQLDANGAFVQAFSCDTPKVLIVFSYYGVIAKVRAL